MEGDHGQHKSIFFFSTARGLLMVPWADLMPLLALKLLLGMGEARVLRILYPSHPTTPEQDPIAGSD